MRQAKFLPAACLSIAVGPVSWAATEASFSEQAFAASQQEGRPILVDITASWCPTCAKQPPILGQLMNDPALRDLAVYRADFGTQKDVVPVLGARMQSTPIVFHGGAERGRSIGDTDPASSRVLLEKANRQPSGAWLTDLTTRF